LVDAGFEVEVFESTEGVGGHSRAEYLNGVLYEPNGAHIFHTSDEEVAALVQRFGMTRRFSHQVLSQVYLSDDDEVPFTLHWPPQISELKSLPIWATIERELALLPPKPDPSNFETCVTSMMGPTLYRLFIKDYTNKQWGRPAHELSASLAPKRVELRDDDHFGLFRDPWEFFPSGGVNDVVEAMLKGISVTTGARLRLGELQSMQDSIEAFILTCPLDDFVGEDGALEWRGIKMRSRCLSVDDERATITAGYVVNHPSARVPYTRTVETKHASGQLIKATVVSEELPGAPERHYPVPTLDNRYERANAQLQEQIRESIDRPIVFCGRLASYTYINQDGAIRQGLSAGAAVAQILSRGDPGPS
jgi:UDP-galactopyranose mutase